MDAPDNQLQKAPMKSVQFSLFLALALTASFTLAQTTNTWSTSATTTDWNTPTNWSLNRVPLATDDVVIVPGATNPLLLSTTAVAYSVEMQSGASLSISSVGSLTINGSKVVGGLPTAFYNKGTVSNRGQLVIGNTDAVGYRGLWNEATFVNQPGVYSLRVTYTNECGSSSAVSQQMRVNRSCP